VVAREERNSNATNSAERKVRAPIFSRNDFFHDREKKSEKFFSASRRRKNFSHSALFTGKDEGATRR
jgi:hypothetical protein